MQDNVNPSEPLDILPEEPRDEAKAQPQTKPHSQGNPQTKARPQTGSRPKAKPQNKPRPSGAKQAQPKKQAPAKKKPQPEPQDDDLPEWLGKLIDWVMDTPKRLKTLPGKLKRLWGSLFYRIYFITVAVVLIAIFIGLRWLTGVVADYEVAEPSHVAEEVAKMFEDGDYDAIYDLDTSAQEIAEGDKAFYVQSLKDVSAGKRVSWSFATGSDAERRYTVTLDGGRFADFTLVPSGQTTSHGNTLWQLGSITTHVVTESAIMAADPNMASCRIQAPAEYTVTIDVNPLTDADIIRRGISILPDKFELPKGVTAPTLVEYGFNSEAEKPEIAVTDSSGAAMDIRESSENIWVCMPREDSDMKAKCQDSVEKIAERIAKFTSQDLSQGAVRESAVPESPAEKQLKNFNNSWAPTHKRVSFENMEVSEFYVLSDDCFVCHVTFDFIITSVRNNDYPYHTEYTFCITKYRNGGRLYNLTFN